MKMMQPITGKRPAKIANVKVFSCNESYFFGCKLKQRPELE